MKPRKKEKAGILFISNLFKPISFGGAEKNIYEIACDLGQMGYKVLVLTRRFKGLSQLENSEGIKIYRVFSLGLRNLSWLIFTVSSIIFLTKNFSRLRNFVCIVDADSPGLLGIFFNFFLNKSVILHLRGVGELKDIIKSFWRRAFFLCVVKFSDKIVVCAKIFRYYLDQLRIVRSKVLYIPNGVDVHFFKRECDLQLKNRLTALYVGRLVEGKGVESVIRAVPRILYEIPSFKFIIVGSGPQEKNLRYLATKLGVEKNILFLGYKRNVKRYYEIADVLILASFNEGMPNVILEAMAMELPVIATPVGGIPEVVVNGVNGLICDHTSEDIAEKVIKVLSKNKVRLELGRKARESVIIHYSRERQVQAYLKLFQQIIKHQESRYK